MLVATREGRTWLFPRTVLFHHRLLAFRLPVNVPLFPCSLSSTLLSVPLAHARTRHISLSFFRSIRTAPFHENSRRSLAWAISSSPFNLPRTCPLPVFLSPPCIHPCTPLFLPALKPFRRFKFPSCAHPLEDRPCLVYAALVASFPPCARRTPRSPVFLCSPCLARETFFVRGSFTWLNNDREKDRTFRLKEYRHAAIARLQRRHRETYAFTIHSLSLVSGYPVCSYHRFLVSVEVSRDELRLEFKVPALSVRSSHQASRPSVPAR